jgi:hypothetical protein
MKANAKIYTLKKMFHALILPVIIFHLVSSFLIQIGSPYQPYILHELFWYEQGTLDFADPFKLYLFPC